MRSKNLILIASISAIAAVVVVVVLKLLEQSNPTVIAGGVAGGIAGALSSTMLRKKKSDRN